MTDAKADPAPAPNPRFVALIVACSMFIAQLDGTVVLTALPQIARSFHMRPVDLSIGVTVYMLAQAVPLYALIVANNLPVPWTASFVMMVLLRLSSVVPQAPGNLGFFQWVATQTLIMFGLSREYASGFSLILWAVVTLPLLVIGFIALALEGVNMTHLHKEATAAASRSRQR